MCCRGQAGRGERGNGGKGPLSGAPQRSGALFGFDAQARAARRAHAQVQRALVGGGPADQVHRAAPRRRAAMCNAIRVRAAPTQSHHLAPRPTRAIAVTRTHASTGCAQYTDAARVHRRYSGYYLVLWEYSTRQRAVANRLTRETMRRRWKDPRTALRCCAAFGRMTSELL